MKPLVMALVLAVIAAGYTSWGQDSAQVLTVDHYVRVQSLASEQWSQIYLRERVRAGIVARTTSFAGQVVLFVHGAGTPAEVAFDVPHQDYSWMAFLAGAGFDVFSMDNTGYGRSTRPSAMNDPCNLSSEQRTALAATTCTPGDPHRLTTMASDWKEIAAAVDYLRKLRHVERVTLFGWSLGGPRAGDFAAQHPELVDKLVLLAPAYSRGAAAAPADVPGSGTPFNTQSHAEFLANWDRQVGCADQYDPAAAESVWSAMLASDPVGATWGTGVRRAPNSAPWGWNAARVALVQAPTLLIAGAHDKQVPPDRVRELYADLGTRQKVFIDLGCSSHNAAWEKNHLLLFRASLQWLTAGSVNGAKEGMLRLGY